MKKNCTIFLILIIIRSLLCLSSFANDDTLYVDILLQKNLFKVTILGIDLNRKLYSINGKTPQSTFKKGKNDKGLTKAIQFICKNGNSKNEKREEFQLISHVNSPAGILQYDHQKYKGDLIVYREPVSGTCFLVNRIPLEKYISFILPMEMNAKWPAESLKAQAVVGRSYAFNQIIKRKKNFRISGRDDKVYDLENSERDQVSGALFDETSDTSLAAKATLGEILIHPSLNLNSPIFYHASCGGYTFLPEEVWDQKVEGYKNIRCQNHPISHLKEWSLKVKKREFTKLVNESLSEEQRNVFKRDQSYTFENNNDKRSSKIKIKIKMNNSFVFISKSKVRRYFGLKGVLSNNFTINIKDESYFIISGTGHGHGVGLCQMGALIMAKQGKNYKEILSYYFPNHKIYNYLSDPSSLMEKI